MSQTNAENENEIVTGDGGVDSLEETLAAAERALEAALRSATTATRELKKALAGARVGQVRDIRKALANATVAAAGLADETAAVNAALAVDEQQYLASGGYTKELLAVAEARGVRVFEEEDLLLCYPSLLKVIPADASVEVDRVRERRIRPSVLVDILARTQERTPRFRVEAFLDSLRAGYELVVAGEGKKTDGIVRVVDIWSTLTLLPNQRGQYSKQEFARDLYLLDQSGVTRTGRSPREVRFAASTGTKGAGTLVTVARSGQRQQYWGVWFTLDETGGE